MDNNAKKRPFYIAKILYEQTDEEHYLTTVQLIQILRESYAIESHRKTIKSDIELLQQVGMDIDVVKSTQNKYALLGRAFDIAELKLLIDAVESSKFITKKKSIELSEKIEKLTSKYNAESLARNIEVENRLKADNELIYYIIDEINEAINQNKKISFQYFTYNVKKEKAIRNTGTPYIFSPYKLVWNGDHYYVVGYSEKHKAIGTFRVDRIMKKPAILDEPATPKPEEFDMDHYLNTMFRMYNAKRCKVDLICNNDTVDSIIDRFGNDVEILAYDMNSYRIIVDVAVSHIFYTWIFGFGGKVKIKGPENVKKEYIELLDNAIDFAK